MSSSRSSEQKQYESSAMDEYRWKAKELREVAIYKCNFFLQLQNAPKDSGGYVTAARSDCNDAWKEFHKHLNKSS